MDDGLGAVEYVRELLPLTRVNVVRRERGFEWWAGSLRQQVWAEKPVQNQGSTVSRLHCRTDFVRGFKATDEQVAALGELMRGATLSAIIRNPEDPGRLQLASSCYINESTAGWMPWLFGMVTAWQNWEAHQIGHEAAKLLGAELDATAHPEGKILQTLHENIAIVGSGVGKVATHPSRFAGEEMSELKPFLSRPPIVLCTGDTRALTFELPFLGETSLAMLQTAESHPRNGNGLHTELRLPVELANGTMQCLEMNELELKGDTWAHLLGSWTERENGPVFRMFCSNLVFQPGLLLAHALNTVIRARWWAEVVYEDDWEEGGYENACRQKEILLMVLREEAKGQSKGGLFGRLFGRR